MVILDGPFVVDGVDQSLVGGEKQRHAWGFVDASALGFDDPVLDLVAAAETVAAADLVGLHHQGDLVGERLAVNGNRPAFLKADASLPRFGHPLSDPKT